MINPQMKKGLLDVCVLSLLSQGDSYGYRIIKDLSAYIKLPEDSSALIRFSTASGSFHNEFDSHHGKTGRPAGDGEYYIGSGGDCEISADTVSGDISISH